MADLFVDDVLHHLTPGLRHYPAVLLFDRVADLVRDSETLLLSVGLAVLAEDSLALRLGHHLTVVLSGALLLQHSPTLLL